MISRILFVPAVHATAVVPYIPPGSPFGWAAVSAAVLAYYRVIPPVSDVEHWGHHLLNKNPEVSQWTHDEQPIGRIDKALAGTYAGQVLKRRDNITQTKFKHLVIHSLSADKPVIAGMSVPPFNTGHALLIYGYYNKSILYSCPRKGNQAASFEAFYNNLTSKRMSFNYLYFTKQPPRRETCAATPSGSPDQRAAKVPFPRNPMLRRSASAATEAHPALACAGSK
ncbi:papain-like cysteine protease family protein [Acanthopleuribacter pedis]|uniref:Uncharacterized protein n=1 Tax=Acanthopleuribacter pedis TaxID=442870 RepID=A0A8J7QJW5_9BACT|nr:papain-like cysteine protease family protein [Acanthopleuribacter pedis]MBO1321380.1 hypothetical protein [Acanthopleuribacter pedis]